MGDVTLYQSVMEKFAPKTSPAALASSTTPATVVIPHPAQIAWTQEERAYINLIFMMNEGIHQRLIGGADSLDEVCLYKAFRIARKALQDFKQGLKCEKLPRGFGVLHILAGALALDGFWQVIRWFR